MIPKRVIKMLESEYTRAKKSEWVHKPLAFALYQVWKRQDIIERDRKGNADKQKITCLNCKYLEITLPYGECSLKPRIVNPDDTCEYAEPKEKGR